MDPFSHSFTLKSLDLGTVLDAGKNRDEGHNYSPQESQSHKHLGKKSKMASFLHLNYWKLQAGVLVPCTYS